MIELRTLGAVDLRGEARGELEPLLGQPKRLALLVYLAVARPRGFHSRDSLMGLFWPELNAGRARNALRQALFFLRQTLGDRVLAVRGPGDVGLVPDALWCDAVDFDRAVEERDLERAAELYRGDFLAGFHFSDAPYEFEEWLEGERTRLRRLVQSTLQTLADREEAAGRIQGAAVLLRRAVATEPDDERAVRRLIGLLDSAGDRAGALAVYDVFRARSLEEYGAPPSPETEAVARGVRERRHTAAAPVDPLAGRGPLPVPLTPLVGREREVREVLTVLRRPETRLVTLTGPGGCGKTRLATEVAARFAREDEGTVHFVSLASVSGASFVMSTIARALGAPKGKGALDGLRRHLARRRLLLVLDNLEHVTQAATDLVDLLTAAPSVKILTTSREPLKVRVERAMPVPPLSLPDPRGPNTPEVIGSSDAVALFVERARAADASFRLHDRNAGRVAEICRKLDGLPLAIEIAAAHTRLYTPETLTEKLGDPLAVLKDGPRDMPERHRTLAGTIGWSYDLLSPDERALFRRASLFVGGAPLEAIAAMWEACGGSLAEAVDLVASLVDKNLLRREEGSEGRTRVGMLETVREFGLAELDREGEKETWGRWQADYWLSWVEPGEGIYCTLDEPGWLDRLDREHDNLRAALDWAFDTGEVETAMRLAAALWWYWWVRGHFADGRRWLERALDRGDDLSPTLRARAMLGAGQLAGGQGDQERAVELLEQSLAIHRDTGDRQEMATVLLNLGYALREAGDYRRARVSMEEALALRHELEDGRGVATALQALGETALREGDLETARDLLEESFVLAQRSGNRLRAARALLSLGDLARDHGDHDRAAVLYERGLERFRALKQTTGVGQALSTLADLARRRGTNDRARELYAEALVLSRDTGSIPHIVSNLIGFAALAAAQGRPERAARLCGGIDALVESLGVVFPREERELYETTVASTRTAIGERDFAEQWAAGRRMSTEETITLALQLTPPGPSAPRWQRAAGS